MLMLNRAFFSLQSRVDPDLGRARNLGLNAALDAAFYRLGIWGIPLATSLVNIAGTIAAAHAAPAALGRIELRRTPDASLRITVASAVLAGVCYGSGGRSTTRSAAVRRAVVSLGLALAVGAAAYLLVCRLLGVHELRALLLLRRRGA